MYICVKNMEKKYGIIDNVIPEVNLFILQDLRNKSNIYL